jgi:tetratricopeptide (TPR) repeat protein
MIYPSTRVHAEEPLKRLEEQKLLPVIRTMPEGLPKLAKEKQAAVFSVGLTLPTGDSVMNKGFFIDGRGLALCPLIFLCYDSTLRFDASDGEILAKPKVLAVFGEQHLALVKFAYKPKAWLEVSDKRPATGEWLALISTLRDPAPLTAPVLALRDNFETKAFPQTFRALSFATARSPAHDRTFADGAPLIDDTGKAIAVYAGSEPLNMQTLRFARPLDGLVNSIKAVLTKPLDLPIPIPRKHHPYDPARLDPLWGILQQNGATGYSADSLARVQKLLVKYPGNRTLQSIEWELMFQSIIQGSPGEAILEAARRTEAPENAPAPDRASYFYRLGRAYCASPGNEAATMDAYRKAFDLAPQTPHLAGANLAGMHLGRGELKEAERVYRKIVSIVPERIDYIEGLQKVLTAKGDWKGVEELTSWIWTLEDLYRSR